MTKKKGHPIPGLTRKKLRQLYLVEGGDQDYFYSQKRWAQQAKVGLKRHGYKNVVIKKWTPKGFRKIRA